MSWKWWHAEAAAVDSGLAMAAEQKWMILLFE
jgi:hypothetical protein